MPLVNQEVRNLFSGVSTQPQSQRDASHWNEQVNAMVYQGRLVGKRPGSIHVAKLSADTGGADPEGFVLTRSATEKYIVMLLDRDIKVYNWFTGAEMTVEAPEGLDYLASSAAGFRTLTVGDTAIITNRSTITRKGTTVSDAGGTTTLLVVRQGNFGTKYGITLDGINVVHETPQSGATDAEKDIATDVIAAELVTLLSAAHGVTFAFTRYNSTIAIVPADAGEPYDIEIGDGLGNEGMVLIKGSVQQFADLPNGAPDGTLLEIRGSDLTAFDNYWVEYSAQTGVWSEVVAPECLLDFDVSTMPHVLQYKGKYMDPARHTAAESSTVFINTDLDLVPNSLVGKRCTNLTDGSQGTVVSNGTQSVTTTTLAGGGRNTFRKGDRVEVTGYGTYFVFRPAPWAKRAVGDTETNPYPSFIDQEIRDIFVTQGRLGFIAKNSIVLSRTRNLFDLFRSTVTQVLPDGPIDITETLPSSSQFHAFTETDDKAVVWSDIAQYELKGEPVLTPETVSLKRIGQYQNLATCRPVVSGSRVFFVGVSSGLNKIMEFTVYGQEKRIAAQSLTEEIPDYIEGTPVQLEADDTVGILLVLTRFEQETRLYALTYITENGQRFQQAWGRWDVGDVQMEPNYAQIGDGGDTLLDPVYYLLTEDGELLTDEDDLPLIQDI